ncbi:MAG: pantetheine-phosphate adenylyltransferase [Gammaproteobacteria bacterium]|nr:pantetheine-phosphate adenylyltransferase [Gammaproteobacteria bacterium]
MGLTIVYPGTFDPITRGHSDLVERASRLCGTVIVAVAEGADKRPFFDIKERVDMARQALAGIPDVEVRPFNSLLVDFVREVGATVVLRGLRAVSDFEYEFQLASMNRKMAPEVETIFLTPAEQYTYISSSLVRQVARFGGDVSEFVHAGVAAALRARADERQP